VQTLIIDNYDSYTFNLYQIIAAINGKPPLVIYNDRINWEELQQLTFDNIVISPGPGRPDNSQDFGICRQILQNLNVPILGVCLGHQGLGYWYGGKIIHAPEVRHGRLSQVYHHQSELFQGIPSPFSVVRYHSLLVAETLPDCLEKIAWTAEGLVMGLRHRQKPFWSVQFHPESICTEYGRNLLENFRKITQNFIQPESKYHPKAEWNGYEKLSALPIPRPQVTPKQQWQVCSQKLNFYVDAEQVFMHLFAEQPNTFWLDSSRVETGMARFSFMGDSNGENSLLVRYYTQTQELTILQSGTVTRCHESIFAYLNRELANRHCESEQLPFDFNCGFVGYFGYELKAECGAELVHPSALPDAIFLLADRIIAFDHQEQEIYLLYLAPKEKIGLAETWFKSTTEKLLHLPPLPPIVATGWQSPVIFRLSRSYQTYINDIQTCLQEIYEGESYQVCLTNHLITDATPDPLTFYRNLRQINPAPYSAFLRFEEIAIACSSPERFLKIDRQGWVETKPIKGTGKRGQNPQEDLFLREQLRHSEKDRSENLMIVDLLRNDLGRVCQIGSIHVPKLMDVETYATVHQMVTTIRGQLRPDLQATDCIQWAFPGGSMTGAPKIRTMQIIDRLEQEARGIYSGTIGFLGLNGTADFNIVIRTAVFTPNRTSIGIGGGIVALSNPQTEFEETLLKANALIQAMLLAVGGEFQPNHYFICNA
jgi:para-aminobenzoate synthetase